MERDLLEAYLAEGLSLERIGALVKRHASTVGYWVRKHGLQAVNSDRNAPKGGIPRDALQALVDSGATIRGMARELDVSYSTVVYWLRRYELQTHRIGRHASHEPLPRVIERTCRHHGLTDHVLEGRGYYRCKRCRMERVAAWCRDAKKRLVVEAVGRCRLCGYDRCPAALEFHHLEPAEKSFGLSVRGITRSLAALRAEARKCVLLCSNCHAEVEAGVVALKQGATFPV